MLTKLTAEDFEICKKHIPKDAKLTLIEADLITDDYDIPFRVLRVYYVEKCTSEFAFENWEFEYELLSGGIANKYKQGEEPLWAFWYKNNNEVKNETH